jgi:hypothetical protein
MQTKAMIVCCALTALHLLQQPSSASFFEMTLERNSIYTPSDMNMVMQLGDEATAEGKYSFKVSVLVGETVIREKPLAATKHAPTVFKLDFPEMRSRTELRCRTELFINGQFIEAREEPLMLWPPLVPVEGQPRDKLIWVFDTSGALQKIFKDLQVHAADATFQAIRDFQDPNIIFVGENVGPKNFQTLKELILSRDTCLETVIFLQQKQFPKDWPIQIASDEEVRRNVSCDPNSTLLSGLNKLDIMNMVSNSVPAKITKRKHEEWKADSHISEVREDAKQIYTYLAMIQNKKLSTVYCQLPVTDDFDKDPRSGLLLRELLEFTFEDRVSTSN